MQITSTSQIYYEEKEGMIDFIREYINNNQIKIIQVPHINSLHTADIL